MLLIFFVFGIVPLLLVSTINYVSGVRAVGNLLRTEIEDRAALTARRVTNRMRVHEAELLALARSHALRDYVRDAMQHTTAAVPHPPAGPNALPAVTHHVLAHVKSFYQSRAQHYASLTCLDAERRPVFRIEGKMNQAGDMEPDVQTGDFVTDRVRVDERVWKVSSRQPFSGWASEAREPFAASLPLTIPIFLAAETETAPRGALIAELKLDALFSEASAEALVPEANQAGARAEGRPMTTRPTRHSRLALALDQHGHLIYHTNEALKHQPVASAMPFFKPLAEQMISGASGSEFYEDATAEHDRWLAAYRPLKIGDESFSLAIAGNFSASVADIRRVGLSGIALSALAALVAVVLLVIVIDRTAQRIERVTQGTAAIARGDLGQRIEVHASDETRVLAESFNVMSHRLQEHITREAETKQFEAFVRLSAMLTHDLKNAITGLSMLVSNMERQFHREEFRADVILSLREATDKLRRIVARLSEPVKSLSGEYRRDAKPTDLIPIIKRVLAATVEPTRPLYELKTQLPDSLVAYVESERIENVFENLVINGLEAMGRRGGTLTIEAGEAGDAKIYFSVGDTGVGMEETFLRRRLFRPFATTKNKGIGLGLYTCREIVEAHGGRLDVESQVGIGTRFRVVLPSGPFTQRQSSPAQVP